jgi:hypothetical protein
VGGLTVLAGATALASAVSARDPLASYRADYRPAPASLLRNGGILFTRLDDALLQTVRISPTRARHIATAPYGSGHGSRVVFESLGGYVDANEIVHDWIGTQSYVPQAVPAYLVRIYTAKVETVDLSRNHYWNVIVNARTGGIITEFSYD